MLSNKTIFLAGLLHTSGFTVDIITDPSLQVHALSPSSRKTMIRGKLRRACATSLVLVVTVDCFHSFVTPGVTQQQVKCTRRWPVSSRTSSRCSMSLQTPPDKQASKLERSDGDGIQEGEKHIAQLSAEGLGVSEQPKNRRVVGVKESTEQDLMWKVNVSTSITLYRHNSSPRFPG